MIRPRTIALLTLCVAVPAWVVTTRLPWGNRWRVALSAPVSRPMAALHQTFMSLTSIVRGPWLHAENDRLRRTLAAQRQEPARLEELTREVDRLRRLLRVKQDAPRPAVAVRVIGRDATPWFRTLLLDAGRDLHLDEGVAVVTESGLAGQLFEVGPTTARALLMTDPRFRAAALVQRSRAHGVVVGTAQGRCYLVYLASADAAQPGDLVMTSGGGVIPKGLAVGEVVRVERDPSGLSWAALVKPAVNAGVLEEVVCLQ